MRKITQKCKIISYSVLSVNILLTAVLVFILKSIDDKKETSHELNTTKTTKGIDSKILNIQKEISIDRESKLRRLNTEEKEIKQVDTTTTTTTTKVVKEQVPVEKPAPPAPDDSSKSS